MAIIFFETKYIIVNIKEYYESALYTVPFNVTADDYELVENFEKKD